VRLSQCRWARRRNDLVPARVEVAGNTLDDAAFARRVPAFEGDDERDPAGIKFVFEFAKPFLVFVKFFVVGFLVDGRFQVYGIEGRRTDVWKFLDGSFFLGRNGLGFGAGDCLP
jgi:hypothetical protein